MTTTEHVTQLAAAFNIRINWIHPLLRDAAASGHRTIICPQCDQVNRVNRAGTIQCGRCHHPLGVHHMIDVVMLAPVVPENDITYSTALHELGHCIHPLGRVAAFEGSRSMRNLHKVSTLRDMRLMLTQEEAAWEWAKANAMFWNDTMERDMVTSLATYRAHARQLGIK